MNREAFEKWVCNPDTPCGEWEAWQAATAAAIPPGYVLVPEVPTEAQWGGLARDIVFWLYAHGAPHTGRKLHDFLRNLGREIPDWLEKEIPDSDSVPAKGTVAVVIYTAMLQEAKEQT